MALKDDYYVVDFHFIDDSRCLRPLIESVQDSPDERPGDPSERVKEQRLRHELRALFLAAGWEGDGETTCIFVPPCLIGREDGWCRVIYHVKQENNGTSWLAIPNNMELSLPDGFLSPRRAK